MPSREELEELIAKWRAEVNPGMRYAAQQLEEALKAAEQDEVSKA